MFTSKRNMLWKRERLWLTSLLLVLGLCAVCASNKPARVGRGRSSAPESPSTNKDQKDVGGFKWFTSKLESRKNETEVVRGRKEESTKKKGQSAKQEKSKNDKVKSSTNATEPWIVKNIEKPKQGGGLSWWFQKQKNRKAEKPESDVKKSGDDEVRTQNPGNDETKTKEEPSKENKSTVVTGSETNTTTNTVSPNATTAFMIMRQPQMRQQPPLFMGQPGMGVPPGQLARPPTNTANVLLVNSAVSLLSAVLRLWFLTSVAKWLHEEETVKPTQHFMWERLNDRYCKDASALQTAMTQAPLGMSDRRWRRIARRQGKPKPPPASYALNDMFSRTVLVVEFHAKSKESMNLDHFQRVVTFILTQHRQHAFGTDKETARQRDLEVVLLVDSPGGSVTDFGAASAQVGRLSSEPGITTTVCVDHVAASGGYMIASQAHQLLAAPFATIGSVGVIREAFNLHDALDKIGIQPLVLKSGESKAPLTMLGPVSNRDMKTAQRALDKVHKAFQDLVRRGRPSLASTEADVLEGDVYFGEEAKSLSLVDRVLTSEEYLLERITAGDRVLKLHKSHQSRFPRRHLLPLDLLRHRADSMRVSLMNFLSSKATAAMLSRLVHTGSMLGFVQYLVRHRFP